MMLLKVTAWEAKDTAGDAERKSATWCKYPTV